MLSIALVDDRTSVSETLACLLRMSGEDSISIFSSGENLLKEMSHGYRPDVVVSDFLMDGINGVELLDTITNLYGDIPGIIMTGYPEGLESLSKFSKSFPLLCKGDTDFFSRLQEYIKDLTGNKVYRSEDNLCRKK